MKALVFLLLLANLLFYAFSAGYFGRPDNPDAARLAQQVAPEKMHLVSRGEAPVAKPAKAPSPVVEAAGETPAEAAVETPPAPAAVETICRRWAHLPLADGNRLAAQIGEKLGKFKVVKRTEAGEGSTWWVHIPPLGGKDEADRKAGELRQLGVTDYFIVQEAGPNRFAISLGIFSSEKGGQERLAELKTRGVRSARLSIRPGKDSQLTLDASGPAADKETLLAVARSVVPKQAAQDCK